MRATKKKQTVMLVKKPHADVVRITADEMRSELLTLAVAWYVRHAQRLGADVLPLFSRGPEPVDSWLSQHGWTDEKWTGQKAADILQHYGLIPRRRKSGPKEKFSENIERARLLRSRGLIPPTANNVRFSERTERERLLRNFKSLLLQAQAIHRRVPRELEDEAGIIRAMGSPPAGLWRELCGIVATYRNKRRGAHALAGLVAAYVLGGDPKTAVVRLDALRHAEARRTNYRRESVIRESSTLAPTSAPKGDADEPPPDDGSRGNPEAPAADTSGPSLKGRRSSLRPLVDQPNRLRRGGSPGVDRVPKAEEHRRPRPRPRGVRKRPPP